MTAYVSGYFMFCCGHTVAVKAVHGRYTENFADIYPVYLQKIRYSINTPDVVQWLQMLTIHRKEDVT